MIIYGIKDLKTDKVVLPVFSDDVRSVNSTIINMIAKNKPGHLASKRFGTKKK